MKLPIASNKTIIRELSALFMQFKGEFALTLGLQVIVACAAIVTPWVIGTAIDQIAQGAPYSSIKRNIYVLIIAVLVQALTAWFADYRARVLGQKIFHTLRTNLVNAVTHLPLSVVEAAGTGDLLGRTTSDIDRVEFVIRQGISRIAVLSLTICVTVGAAVITDIRVGIVVLLAFIPMFFVLRKYLRRSIAAYLATSALIAEFNGDIAETVEHSATVDSMSMREHRIRRTGTILREMWINERYTAWMRAIFGAQTAIVLISPIAISVLWGSWLVGLGLTTAGVVVTVTLYVQQLRWPIEELSWWTDEFQFAWVAFARIFGVAEIASDRLSGEEVPSDDGVCVRNVDFAYREGHPVLKNISLDIKPGERLTIVGPSGSGKSTLGRLIAGVNPPLNGQVEIGGVEVIHLQEKILHQTVALVTQENHIFVGTIRENLQLAAPAASDADLKQALSAVNAHWVESLPEGIDTKVGSGALELPPDYAQQLALARIVLLDPQVLVLDEATSLLDPTAARSAERALARVLEGRTVISIAHRLYTAYDADRVAVLIDGEIAELGTHQELVAQGKEYASLWETWQQD
ncbi:ABC-type multidrug transport system fused ATPase/permease subunit [Arcanobacterium pluranimalium]|uniref:ABC transporter ATP-binding protein n=1 Tax=Arcanobacterium pluranimalium TaxID=108028 RepID=UPI0019583714|nr:ABC transporter ATP-binding protein [Arcanobacterium pluranimalium]MBM7824854.1 ABC-type multidrug transport system fused ATPase/permease subunit [Arcanobacterium pluranimalium]